MSEAYLNTLRGFRLLIDRAFRDLSEGRIGLLFFIESLFEKTDSIANPNSGLMHRSRQPLLFDYFVGAGESYFRGNTTSSAVIDGLWAPH